MIDVVEILQHWHAGAAEVGCCVERWVDPKTCRKYVAVAEKAGIKPGGAVLSRAEWAVMVRGWFP